MTAGTYTIRGGVDESSLTDREIYEANKAELLNAFGSSNCSEYSSNYYCNTYDIFGYVLNYGTIEIGDSENFYCNVYVDGSSVCKVE